MPGLGGKAQNKGSKAQEHYVVCVSRYKKPQVEKAEALDWLEKNWLRRLGQIMQSLVKS